MRLIPRFATSLSLRSQSNPIESLRALSMRRRRVFLLIYAIVILAIVGVMVGNGLNRFVEASTAKTELSVPPEVGVAAPGSELWINVPTVGNEITAVNLYESHRSSEPPADTSTQQWSEEDLLPIKQDQQNLDGAQKMARINISGIDDESILKVDSHYRLVVEGKRLELALPWPEWKMWHEEYTFQTLLSPLPVELETTYKAVAGESIAIRWTEPVANLDVQTAPSMEVSCTVDQNDNRVTYITPRDYEQGTSYKATIVDAVGTNGIDLQEPRSFTIVTPNPVSIAEVTPEDGSFGLEPTQSVAITFSEAIQNRELAEQAITIEPAISGHFEWSQDGKTITFLPNSALPWGTDLTMSVKSGMSLRGVNGGYLSEPTALEFSVRPNKLIDVNLSSQLLNAYDGDQLAMSIWVATGVTGGETPPGTYMVLGKYDSLRMRGYNPSGSYYDIANVPWVMPFYGDYTIHGAPWRTRFGVPGSAGCVSMTTLDAKRLFDWAEVGTKITIHY